MRVPFQWAVESLLLCEPGWYLADAIAGMSGQNACPSATAFAATPAAVGVIFLRERPVGWRNCRRSRFRLSQSGPEARWLWPSAGSGHCSCFRRRRCTAVSKSYPRCWWHSPDGRVTGGQTVKNQVRQVGSDVRTFGNRGQAVALPLRIDACRHVSGQQQIRVVDVEH